MAKNIFTPSNTIEQMIDLRIQQAALEQEIQALKPAFFDACAQHDTNCLETERAIIYRKLTPSQWNYPSPILEHARQLKQLKQDFQKTHEPESGREVIWSVKLLAN
jgi:hypothetical protein